MTLARAAAVLLAGACACAAPAADGDPLAAALQGAGETREWNGLCDASAAVVLEGGGVLVAGDEDNLLRLYRADAVDPAALIPLDAFLDVDARHPEADLEAVATLDGVQYWLASHGRSKAGKPRPSRRRFFATRVTAGKVEPFGTPYGALLDDLLADARYAPFDLGEAARRAPKAAGGLNLEGMAAWDGTLLLGFRNPVPGGDALVAPLLDPRALVEQGGPAAFGEPLRWDLDGRGVRALEPLPDGRMLIAAGSPQGRSDRFYVWSGARDEAPARLAASQLNVEGIAYDAARGKLLLFSDDGTRAVDGTECKRIPDATRQRFRVREVAWPQGRGGRV